MTDSQKTTFLLQFICGLFIFLFVYTALSKLLDIRIFRITLAHFPLIAGHAKSLAVLIPVIELCISLLLFIPQTQKFGLYNAFFLLFIFTAYVGLMYLWGSSLPCSCGGVTSALTWQQHLLLNIVLIVLAAKGIIIKNKI